MPNPKENSIVIVMLIESVNLNHIRIFESVYRSRSMTKAADELSITQSGVSQHIKHLEGLLGVRLFDRVRQRLIPTQQAATFYQSCKDGLSTIERAITDLKGVGPELKGVINVALTASASATFIFSQIASFVHAYPLVKFKIKTGSLNDIAQLIQNGIVDFAIMEGPIADKSLKATMIYEENFVVIGHESYLTKNPMVYQEKKYFSDAVFIDLDEEEGWLKKWFSYHFKGTAPKLTTVAQVSHFADLTELVCEGLGLGIVPEYLVTNMQKNISHVIIVPTANAPMKIQFFLCSLPTRSTSLAVQEFQHFLQPN